MEQAQTQKSLMTYEGVKRLEEELDHLKLVRRQEIAQTIKEAREQGDLSENAEYDAAKDEQRDIEARIDEIEKILRSVEVVAEEDNDGKQVNVGCTVTLLNLDTDQEVTYQIVGSNEANSLEGKISNEAPVGAAIMGKKTGNKVTVQTPAGEMHFKVKKIRLTK